MNYLIIAAHPDDELLGCGASIAKWSQHNHNVHILIMAEGETSRDTKRDINLKANELSNLKKCAEKSASMLGAKSIDFLNFPDNRMDSIELLDVVKLIESYITRYKPDVVVTHHSGDLNIDHRIIHNAVITACRPQPNFCVKRILCFEVLSSTEWQSNLFNKPFIPNWYQNISSTLDLKLKALSLYKTEIREWPHSRSLKTIEYLARYRGSSVGYEAAESFMLLRNIE